MENNDEKDWDIGIDKKTITFVKHVGCGHIDCFFLENANNTFHRLFVRGSMSKTAPCGDSWFWGSANLSTYAARRAMKEGDEALERGIIRSLRFHTCNVYSVATEKSCISAMGNAIGDYLKYRKTREKNGK